MEFSTRLHEPVAREDPWAIGPIIRMGSRMASADMEVRTAGNKLAAMGAEAFIETATPYQE